MGTKYTGKNKIEITVPDSLSASLSVSVIDNSIDSDKTDNIISHLLLTGELKGKLNDPAYYFLNNCDSIRKHLDLVMLTHGWRKFNWADVSQGKFPEIIYPRDTAYISISGKISGATTAQLHNAGDIILMVKQAKQPGNVISIPINPDGTFSADSSDPF